MGAPRSPAAPHPRAAQARAGTVLIIVAGIAAILASLSVVFLARMRSDLEETQLVIQEAQAHIMLVAACSYIQEASRLGYDDGTNLAHPEGYGWIDVRDGGIGPKADARAAGSPPPASWPENDDTRFRCETHKRFEMYVEKIPPFAIRLDAAPNPIDYKVGIPYLTRPDPMPVLPMRAWNPAAPTGADFAEFERGDPTPRMNSTGLSWFRLYRLGGSDPRFAKYNAATFIVTCGAGGTGGFRSFAEAGAEGEATRFGSAAQFQAMQMAEARLWYLVEWSPAVGGQFIFGNIHHKSPTTDANGQSFAITQYSQFPQNRSHYSHSQGKEKNFGGTIRYVQRLTSEPPEW
jgi:hypothetical protein